MNEKEESIPHEWDVKYKHSEYFHFLETRVPRANFNYFIALWSE